MSEQGRYLYAVTRGLSPADIGDQAGLEDAPLDVVEHRGLSVLVSTVSLDEYGEDALKQNLERMEWLEATARTHDRVVRLAAEHGPTAPMRLVTICTDDDGVRRRLDDSYERLVQALDRVEGRVEWSVKAYAPAQGEEPRRQPVDASGAGGGAAYLRARKEALQSRQTQEEAALDLAHEIHEALSLLAVAARQLPPQDPRLTGVEGRMTLNAAYLIDDEASQRFAAEVERLTGQHPESRLSAGGPWPPYSFATLEDV
jgi:hypothetical protein